ncbi:hypothetical protein ACLB2K_027150 [Fragaria x ananassa]
MAVHTQLQFLLLLFSLFTPFATPLTFNFSTFPNDTTSLFIEGDAYYTDGKRLRLTKSAKEPKLAGNIGRATYSEPFLLRGNVSGKFRLADFTTHFTFVIDSQGNKSYGDGFVFFLAPKGSVLNSILGGGGKLGLPVADLPGGNEYPFVAVEFDIYQNPPPTYLDPPYDHVGVDVNNLRSNITMAWSGDIPNAKINNASISYNSSSKTLSVAYTTLVNDTAGIQKQVMRYLRYVVDLKQYLPDWVIVGFSAGTGDRNALPEIISWNFTSTSIVDEFVDSRDTTPPAAPNPDTVDEQKSRNNNKPLLAVGLGVGLSILVAAFALVWFIFRRKSVAGRNVEDTMMVLDNEFERGTGPMKFMYSVLARATNNFDEGEKLGEGGFGGVYRGFIRDLNAFVAVKRVSKGSKQGLKEYAAEVRIIGRLRHRNLVQLIGWCHENGELLLVYELMPHGSLDSYLFKAGSFLNWEVRYKIALGLGSGVLYLHEGCEQCILHRDIKASNVMLDLNFNVKLGDFGLARLVEHEKGSLTTIVAGTRGYMALDYVVSGKASKESDVYSFGVVALEIACGRKSMDFDLENSRIILVDWVWGLYGEGKLIEAADPKLCGDFDERQMECLMIVGLWCAHPDYTCRPPIQQAIQVLNFKDQLPTVPAIMPMAPSFARPVMTFSDTISGSETDHTKSSKSDITNSSGLSSYSANDNSSPL